ncbi:MAG: helix-turn-helix transcriptional regulator [Coprobacillus cateniformis]|nr:helix-turn-helix transcriptional regulator [Coprobacillus cateniformis]
MNNIGQYLKELRLNKQLSLKALAEKIGTTNSILSRVENGHLPKDIPTLFNSLADFYNINVITLYLKVNLISIKSFKEYNGIFNNCEKLTDKEIKHIQNEIDFIIEHRNTK